MVEITRLYERTFMWHMPHLQPEPMALRGAGDMPKRYLMHNTNSISVRHSAWGSVRVLNHIYGGHTACLASTAAQPPQVACTLECAHVVTSWLAT